MNLRPRQGTGLYGIAKRRQERREQNPLRARKPLPNRSKNREENSETRREGRGDSRNTDRRSDKTTGNDRNSDRHSPRSSDRTNNRQDRGNSGRSQSPNTRRSRSDS